MKRIDPRRASWQDEDREAASWLLEHFWIRRDQQPEMYARVRDSEALLRHFFLEKCGLQLLSKPTFVKLEKIPYQVEPWMGIDSFQHPRDYVLLCCLLIVLDAKRIDEQFLLSDFLEGVKAHYPSEPDADPESASAPINWANFQHRKSLVRVIRFATEMGMLAEVDGDIGTFHGKADAEVLYEATVLSRYFTISYPKDLFHFDRVEDVLQHAQTAESETDQRRHRIYRQLLMTPSFTRQDAEPGDFAYLRQFRNRLRDDFEKHTPMHFELTRDTAMLSIAEPRAYQNLFPSRQAIDDLLLHFAVELRQHWQEDRDSDAAVLELTRFEFERLLQACRQRTSHGWTKELRESNLNSLAKLVLQELISWHFAKLNPTDDLIEILPLMGRLCGHYPARYAKSKV